jgi:hypothetical protein
MAKIDHAQSQTALDGPLTRAQAAQFLGVRAQTLRNWLCKDKGPRAFKIGGRVFYKIDDLRAFVRVVKQ